MDWLPNLKTVRDNEVKASEESDEVQALKAKLERAQVVKEQFKSIDIKVSREYDELTHDNIATAEASEREPKEAQKEENDQNKL